MAQSRRKSKDRIASVKGDKSNIKNDNSARIVSWFPITQSQRDQFILLTIRGGWVGIGMLVLFWIVVRIIGPAAGWWVPADMK